MRVERWRRMDEICRAALERDESQRADFLREACAGDEELREEIDSLLAAHDRAADFLQTPALEMVAKDVAEARARSLIGRKTGHYQIRSLLGMGGMGEVIERWIRGWTVWWR